jgi:hypothetical protein
LLCGNSIYPSELIHKISPSQGGLGGLVMSLLRID